MRTGILAATLVNTSGMRPPGSAPAQPKDFMPEFGGIAATPEPEGIDGRRLRAGLEAVFGDRIKRNDTAETDVSDG